MSPSITCHKQSSYFYVDNPILVNFVSPDNMSLANNSLGIIDNPINIIQLVCKDQIYNFFIFVVYECSCLINVSSVYVISGLTRDNENCANKLAHIQRDDTT